MRERESISIIMPIYNAELFLHESIGSVLNQTFENWELILVNDGSKDDTAKICREYALKDKRIRYVEKENGGVSSARNIGLKNASGKYITFMDADDLLLNDALEKMLQAMTHNVGIAVLGLQYMYPDNTMSPIGHRLKKGVYGYSEISKQIIDDGTLSGFLLHSVCGVIYKKIVIDSVELKFDTRVKYNEDGLFNTEYVLNSKESVFVGYCDMVYSYRINPESATHIVDKTSDNYRNNMSYIEEKLLGYAANSECNIETQIKRRKATLALEELISLSRELSLSKSRTRDILQNITVLKNGNDLNQDNMGLGKRLFCLAAKYDLYLVIVMLLKLYCRRKK